MDKKQPHPLFKLATELGPLIIFFIANAKFNLFVATGAFMVAVIIAMVASYMVTRHVPMMTIVTAIVVVVMGTFTLILHDETFIKWKPSVLYWLFACVLGASELLFHKNLIRKMMGEQIQLPDAAWKKLNFSWIGFFACMGFVNLYVAFNFSTDTWVNFKLFGGMGLMLAFVIGQALFLAKYVEQKESK